MWYRSANFWNNVTNTTSSSRETSVKTNSNAGGLWAEFLALMKSLVGVLLLAAFLRAFIFDPFKIPSSSMVPTLQVGDYILVFKIRYGLRIPWVVNAAYQWSGPTRGSVVVFTRPDEPATAEDESANYFIKRVMGLPGDTIEVRGAQVFVNSQPIQESYARWSQGGSLEGNWGPKTIPPGHIFLLGDNRDGSKDSRFWEDPFIDVRRVVGPAFVVFWSFDSWSRIGNIIK